jgi:hypothetical protein
MTDESKLTPEALAEARARVASILTAAPVAAEGVEAAAETAETAGQTEPTSTASAPAPITPTPTPTLTRATRSEPTVNVSLPQDVYDHFAQLAAADERTVSKYLQRVLRDLSRGVRAAAQQQQAAPAAE